MRLSRSSRLGVPACLILLLGIASCKNSDTTTSPGAIATVTVNSPDSATSGQPFTVDVNATAVGVAGVHNGLVMVTFPSPLTVTATDPSPGTTATFTSGSVSWNLGTLDSNTNSSLHVTVMGTLAPGAPGQMVTITASLTADGISAGQAVAQDTVQVNP